MDSFVLRWRALFWGRVWGTVAVLTLAWSIGTGLLLRAVTPEWIAGRYGRCEPVLVQPLIQSFGDVLSLPLHALAAAPLGLYVSGLEVGCIVLLVALIPAAFLEQGTARRVLGAPVVAALALLLLPISWDVELAAVHHAGRLPALACSNR
jgi:hypothetical protein